MVKPNSKKWIQLASVSACFLLFCVFIGFAYFAKKNAQSLFKEEISPLMMVDTLDNSDISTVEELPPILSPNIEFHVLDVLDDISDIIQEIQSVDDIPDLKITDH